MHQDNPPGRRASGRIAQEKVHLLSLERCTTFAELEELRVKDDAVNSTDIEGVVVSLKVTAAIHWQFECAKIAYRGDGCPAQTVVLMVTENGHVDMRSKRVVFSIHRFKETAPVPGRLAVVREIADNRCKVC